MAGADHHRLVGDAVAGVDHHRLVGDADVDLLPRVLGVATLTLAECLRKEMRHAQCRLLLSLS